MLSSSISYLMVRMTWRALAFALAAPLWIGPATGYASGYALIPPSSEPYAYGDGNVCFFVHAMSTSVRRQRQTV
jgi:hypothetical protein